MLKFFCFQSPTVVNVVMREEMRVKNFALNMRELMLVSNYVFTPGLRPHLSVAVAGAGWLIVSMTTSFVQIFLTTNEIQTTCLSIQRRSKEKNVLN